MPSLQVPPLPFLLLSSGRQIQGLNPRKPLLPPWPSNWSPRTQSRSPPPTHPPHRLQRNLAECTSENVAPLCIITPGGGQTKSRTPEPGIKVLSVIPPLPRGLPLSASAPPREPRAPTAQKQFFKRTTALTLPGLPALHVPSEPPHFVEIQFRHPNFLDALSS